MKNFLPHIYFILIFLLFNIIPAKSTSGSFGYIPKDKLSSLLKVYPNPAKDKKITVEMQEKEVSSIRIMNITGREVFFKKNDIPQSIILLDLQKVPDGIYLIQITLSDNQSIAQKLIISSP